VQSTLSGCGVNQITEINNKCNHLVWGGVRKVVNLDYLSNLVCIISQCTYFIGKFGREVNQYMRMERYS